MRPPSVGVAVNMGELGGRLGEPNICDLRDRILCEAGSGMAVRDGRT